MLTRAIRGEGEEKGEKRRKRKEYKRRRREHTGVPLRTFVSEISQIRL